MGPPRNAGFRQETRPKSKPRSAGRLSKQPRRMPVVGPEEIETGVKTGRMIGDQKMRQFVSNASFPAPSSGRKPFGQRAPRPRPFRKKKDPARGPPTPERFLGPFYPADIRASSFDKKTALLAGGSDAQLVAVLLVEGRIVVKAAARSGDGGGRSGFEQCLRRKQAF